eukprot:TRINITY_DN8158_c0_g1_i2.p1 TRINITY_DN8158_c0_g1~~TRINITY_DN8158_c0_g1_i2.p1  ORF type:complete len:435 (+),score=91.94 TRINITY_DN8158_c0_g1_i2:99-1403(+)
MRTSFGRTAMRGAVGSFLRRRVVGQARTASTPAVDTVAVMNGSVRVGFADGAAATFDRRMLRLASDDVRLGTSQRKIYPSDPVIRGAVIDSAKTVDGVVHIQWADGTQQTLEGGWLRQHTVNKDELKADSESRRPSVPEVSPPLPELTWSELQTERGVWNWVKNLNDVGLCLLRGVPTGLGTVMDAAGLIAPPMNTLYPSPFDVRVEEKPINVAYTAEGLVLHQDMAYYESPPGIQFLHCVELADSVTGGENMLLDAHAAAELLRERSPAHFDALCRIPATFQKDHLDRDHPAQFWYHRPHIATNADREVIAVFWSPPFEGELRIPECDVDPYFNAYAAFADIINSPEAERRCGWRLRLGEGDLLSFSNRRLLHGREPIGGSGVRHLQGCYVSADDFGNAFRNLARRNAPPGDGPAAAFGGRGGAQCWGFQCWR